MKISVTEELEKLQESKLLSLESFKHGSLSVEVYKPQRIDRQEPHTRDEVYIVISGRGEFYTNGKQSLFQAGDFFFVPAGAEHRFEKFTEDFATWVIFYGPEGGERPK